MSYTCTVVVLLLLGFPTGLWAGPFGGTGGTASLSHATDCTAGGVSGQLGQACVDLDDGKLWTCKTPSAGGVAGVCDSPGDWLATGFTAAGGGISTINAASGTAQTIGGTAPVAVSTDTGTNTTSVALTGQVPATQVSITPTGDVAATTGQASIAELAAEKATTATVTTHTADTAAHSATSVNTPSRIVTRDGSGNFAATTITGNLTGNATSASSAATLTGKTTVGTGTDLRMSTGSFATDDCVKVDASGNLATAGAECGTGAGGGGSQSFQDVVTIGRTVTDANDAASQVCIGGIDTGTEYKWCWYGNAVEGPVQQVFPAGDMKWRLSEAFTLQILASDATPIATFDEATKTLIVPNQITSPGIVKQFSSSTAPGPTNDETEGYAVHSEWIETTSDPNVLWVCTDATPSAAVWIPVSSFVQVDKSLNDAFNVGKNITGANSEANAVCWGDGTGKVCEWYDGATGAHREVTPAQHQSQDISAGFAYIIRYNGTEISRWDSTGKQIYLNTGRPLKSVEVQGYEFGACAYTEAVIVAGRPKLGMFTCTDADTDGFYFNFATPLNWNAGTITVRLSALSVNAAPTGNVVLSCSGQAVRDGDVVATVTTAGEQTVTLGLATQYKEEQATSAAITLNGTAAAGARLYMHCDVDATLTTANSMADVRILPMAKVFYTTVSNSE